ncbi:MAG: rod-binding protein [Rubricella sp.]
MQVGEIGSATALPSRPGSLREVADAFEAAFIAEMLEQAGFGEARQFGGGGAGEAPFAEMLAEEHARALVSRGGFGLAEAIMRALVEDVR